MICRSCKFSLQGNEKFCPNCGAPLCEDYPDKTNRQFSPPPPPDIFFTPVKQEPTRESSIFREAIPAACTEAVLPQKKQRRYPKAPIILALVILLAVLITGIFAAAEHFNVAPVIMQYLNGTAGEADEKKNSSAEETTLTDTGTVMPEISYTPTQAFVANRPSLSLRKGPSDSYGLIKNLTSGCQLQILGGTVNDEIWVYVYIPYYDCYGWLNSSFITLYNSLEGPEEASQTTAASAEEKP